jgi:uncharacterized membrane protein YczE
VQLYVGLLGFGVSASMLLLGSLGVDPWDVFHQGLSRQIGLGVGTWALIVSAAVLLLWIPLRQWPGLGTVSNGLLVGLIIDAMLAGFHTPHSLVLRWVLMLGGVLLNGVATGAYIGAGLGPGPRDGLMMGLAARGHQIRIVRTCLELTVFAIGWILGGNVGIGTVVYALSIGPLAHFFVPYFAIAGAGAPGEPEALEGH